MSRSSHKRKRLPWAFEKRVCNRSYWFTETLSYKVLLGISVTMVAEGCLSLKRVVGIRTSTVNTFLCDLHQTLL